MDKEMNKLRSNGRLKLEKAILHLCTRDDEGLLDAIYQINSALFTLIAYSEHKDEILEQIVIPSIEGVRKNSPDFKPYMLNDK